MMREAQDFEDESDTLVAVLGDDDMFATITQFKNWTIEDVIGNLHIWNVAALMTLQVPEAFQQLIRYIIAAFQTGKSHVDVQHEWLDAHVGGIRGKILFDAHCNCYPQVVVAYGEADPEHRVAWAGPSVIAAKNRPLSSPMSN